MKWVKRGLINFPRGNHVWANNSALTPTPVLLNDSVIRVYAGFRDSQGVSRIGYLDLDAENPLKVLNFSSEPVLDIGADGCFDDNGVILGDVVETNDGIFMFYVGFQIVKKAKFLAFSGVAVSHDGGDNYSRLSNAPILDRCKGQTTIGAIHSVIFENGIWRIWYASGDDWEVIKGISYPKYHIRYVETDDLLNIQAQSRVCIVPEADEYRIGRPRVYKNNDGFIMYFTKGTLSGSYFPGIAYSKDGVIWSRHDEDFGLDLSPSGWDSQTLCYPALIECKGKTFMFYNGNNMGFDGFGLAELESF